MRRVTRHAPGYTASHISGLGGWGGRARCVGPGSRSRLSLAPSEPRASLDAPRNKGAPLDAAAASTLSCAASALARWPPKWAAIRPARRQVRRAARRRPRGRAPWWRRRRKTRAGPSYPRRRQGAASNPPPACLPAGRPCPPPAARCGAPWPAPISPSRLALLGEAVPERLHHQRHVLGARIVAHDADAPDFPRRGPEPPRNLE